MEHFNKLTPAEAERLSILAEECAEVIQVVGKIQRHGFESGHPNGGPSNRALLEKELGDVRFAMDFMREGGDVDLDHIDQAMSEKALNIQQYLHHNKHLIGIQQEPDLWEDSAETDLERDLKCCADEEAIEQVVEKHYQYCCSDCDQPITECDCN